MRRRFVPAAGVRPQPVRGCWTICLVLGRSQTRARGISREASRAGLGLVFPKLPSRPRLSPAPPCLCEVASLCTSQRPLPPAQRPVFGARRAHSSGYLSLSSAPAMSPWKQADKLIPAQVRCQKALIYCSLLYLLPSLKFAEGRRSGALFPSPAGRASPHTPPTPRRTGPTALRNAVVRASSAAFWSGSDARARHRAKRRGPGLEARPFPGAGHG